MNQIIETAIQYLSIHPYLYMFIGLLFAGETILIPAIYLAVAQNLKLSYIVAIAMTATLISDYFWYYVGLHMNKVLGHRMVSERLRSSIEKLSHAFSKRASLVLFLSKFVYGTRIASQILAGQKKMTLRTYFVVNFLGSLTLIALIAILIYSVDATVANIQGIVHEVEIILLIAFALIIGGHLVFGSYIKRKWFQ